MKYLSMIGVLAIGFLASPAHAQNLMHQVAGTWTLISGAEQFADGKKVKPWWLAISSSILRAICPFLSLPKIGRQPARLIRANPQDR
jgi:hypothetical protein